jgi:putative transposase
MRPGSYNEETLIEFVGELHNHLDGDKVTIIWDGLPSHRSRAMKAFIASQRSWPVVERLPGYAHDLNPVEMIWGNLKASELANLCPDTIEEAALYADAGLARIGADAQLCLAFLRHTGLSLRPVCHCIMRSSLRISALRRCSKVGGEGLRLCDGAFDGTASGGHEEVGNGVSTRAEIGEVEDPRRAGRTHRMAPRPRPGGAAGRRDAEGRPGPTAASS